MGKRSYCKTPMRGQALEERQHNFNEVTFGYSLEEGKLEASRCLQCKDAPCMKHCPVMIDIPGFIKQIKLGNMAEARKILARYTNLPAICGRVCPQEKQCEMACRLGRSKKFEPVAIGALERLVADWSFKQPVEVEKVLQNKGRVAVVGAGPSGLTVAGDLAKMGYQVVIYEAFQIAGGILSYGIPDFRLPGHVVKKEIDYVKALGVEIINDVVVGKTISMSKILNDFDACYIGVGANKPYSLNIPGNSLKGVYSSRDYLTRVNFLHNSAGFTKDGITLPQANRTVVIGGGNVAMDSARSAKRLGSDHVTVVYRRSKEELPAFVKEYRESVEEGIKYEWLTNPIAYLGNSAGYLTGIKCIRMCLGDVDASGRRRPIPIPNSEFVIETDNVVEAIGQGSSETLLRDIPGLKNDHGYIQTNKQSCTTSIPGVFAGGDVVTGAATVVLAMGAGKMAAKEIDHYIQKHHEFVLS